MGRSDVLGALFVFWEERFQRVRRRDSASMERKIIARPREARGMEHARLGMMEREP